jgi:hypothetical protein
MAVADRTFRRTRSPLSYPRTVPAYLRRTREVRNQEIIGTTDIYAGTASYPFTVRPQTVPAPQSLDWGGVVRRYAKADGGL